MIRIPLSSTLIPLRWFKRSDKTNEEERQQDDSNYFRASCFVRIAEQSFILRAATRIQRKITTPVLITEVICTLSAGYEQEQADVKRKIITLEDLIENGEKQAKDLKHLLANVRKYTDPEELTPEMLNDLVDKILVHAPDKSSGHRTQRIEIYYNAVGIIDLPTNTGSGQATSASKLAV